MNMLLDNIKEFLKKMPVLHSLGIKALYAWAKIKFPGSSDYWIVHYRLYCKKGARPSSKQQKFNIIAACSRKTHNTCNQR